MEPAERKAFKFSNYGWYHTLYGSIGDVIDNCNALKTFECYWKMYTMNHFVFQVSRRYAFGM
jgi:hypothetical protein